MSRNRESFALGSVTPIEVMGVAKFMVCAVKNDETIVPVEWTRTNGSTLYMTYQSLGGARDGYRRVDNGADRTFWDHVDELCILDRNAGEYRNLDGVLVAPLLADEGLGDTPRPEEELGDESAAEDDATDNSELESGVMSTDEIRDALRSLTGLARGASRLIDFLMDTGATFSMGFNRTDEMWTCMATWGEEAPDSPMAGAAAHGMDPDPGKAIQGMLGEAGIKMEEG